MGLTSSKWSIRATTNRFIYDQIIENSAIRSSDIETLGEWTDIAGK